MKALAYEVREGAFRPAATTTLFELGRLTTQYDVAPDGRRFLFLARSPGTPDQAQAGAAPEPPRRCSPT